MPDGGVVNLVIAVPADYSDVGFTLDVWAPVGSRLVGNGGQVNVVTVLHGWNETARIKAKVKTGFPVKLGARYRGQDLGTFVFDNGRGTAIWSW